MSYRQRFNYQLDRHCSKTRVAARVTYTHYVTAVRCAEADKRELEKAVAAEAATDMGAPVVRAVSTIKGIDVASAFYLAAEAGCFSRFGSAAEYASWCGLVPSEHSSGERESHGHITKTGNAASRRTLVEAAWHFASCSERPKRLPNGWEVSAEIRRRGDDCTRRLARRHGELTGSGHNRRVANVAVARELACWVWEIGCRAEGTYRG